MFCYNGMFKKAEKSLEFVSNIEHQLSSTLKSILIRKRI